MPGGPAKPGGNKEFSDDASGDNPGGNTDVESSIFGLDKPGGNDGFCKDDSFKPGGIAIPPLLLFSRCAVYFSFTSNPGIVDVKLDIPGGVIEVSKLSNPGATLITGVSFFTDSFA